MTKVKLFRFCVSNASIGVDKNHRLYTNFAQKRKELASVEEIENTINNFIKDKDVISINVSTVDVNYHNNGLTNTIDLIYTITYID